MTIWMDRGNQAVAVYAELNLSERVFFGIIDCSNWAASWRSALETSCAGSMDQSEPRIKQLHPCSGISGLWHWSHSQDRRSTAIAADVSPLG